MTKLDIPGVDNCWLVEPGVLYRGAQPTPEGYDTLKALGINAVLSLRAADAEMESDRRDVVGTGMLFFNVPMGDVGIPSQSQIREALTIIDDPANQPVFVHCKRGADRTGVVCSCYQIQHNKQTAEAVLHEFEDALAGQMLEFWMLAAVLEFTDETVKDHASLRT